MEQRVSLITLGVADVARATAFYVSLGWSPSKTASNDHVTFFQLGCTTLGLYGLSALCEDANLNSTTDGFGGVTLAYNTRTKEDVDQILGEVESKGATITQPGAETFWGGYTGYFSDPDGHIWEITWNPFFELAEDGSIHLPD